MNGVPWPAKILNSAAFILQQSIRSDQARGWKKLRLHMAPLWTREYRWYKYSSTASGSRWLHTYHPVCLRAAEVILDVTLDKCELTIKGTQPCIKWISAAAAEAVAEFQRFWRADPSGTTPFDFPRTADSNGTMAFHFPRNILLTHSGEYFLLSFVLVSVVTILWKERKVRQVQSGATFSLQRIESASKGQSLQQESCERSIVYVCSHANLVI